MSERGESRPRRNRGTRAQQSVRLWLRLLSLHNLIEAQLRRRLQERFDCTLPQFDVLAELDFAGEAQTMSQVSRKLMVSNGNLTGVVDRLVRDGLVQRAVAPHDRRVQLLSLSDAGREHFRGMAAEHAGWVQELFAGLPRAALDDAVGGVHALRDVVRLHAEPVSRPTRRRGPQPKEPVR